MTKTCRRCGEAKPLSEFRKDGYMCVLCDRADQRQRYAANREDRSDKVYARSIERLYGLTIDQYEDMQVAQQGRCAICDVLVEGRMQVDHDHETGRVRGLLCGGCNTMLAGARDSAETLRRAIAYLLEHSPAHLLAARITPRG